MTAFTNERNLCNRITLLVQLITDIIWQTTATLDGSGGLGFMTFAVMMSLLVWQRMKCQTRLQLEESLNLDHLFITWFTLLFGFHYLSN